MASARCFLTGEEYSPLELHNLIAKSLEYKQGRGKEDHMVLTNKSVALLFEKPSLRTRVSFSVAVAELGGNPIEILSSSRKNEEPEDTIRVLSGYVHALMMRTFDHQILKRMVPHTRIPIINGLSDSHHPCQALADVMTLTERYGDLRGKKVAWLGDGNNVLHSLLLIAPAFGVNVCFACPEGYGPNSLIVKKALKLAQANGCVVEGISSITHALKNADAVYTDVWTSMGAEEEETERDRIFLAYQLNIESYQFAKPEAAILHCMPMVRGKEITEEMIDHPHSLIFQQSENRLHVQKALLADLCLPQGKT
ncbi:MAG: ornithine carbamoyltransferase [Bdellovibrionales bacterium]|nr:ornithine carbamoyltransferase [Bdellovibrionales bacterium]